MGLFDKLKNVVDHTKGVLEQKLGNAEAVDAEDTSRHSPDALDQPPDFTVAKALFAVGKNDWDTVREYLAFNPEFARAHDWNDLSMLHKAAQYGRIEITQLLLEHGACPDGLYNHKTPLHFAVSVDNLWVKANLKEDFAAYQTRRRDVVKLLLDAGAELNIFDDHGETPLHTAARMGLGGVMQLMLERGVDINLLTAVEEEGSPYAGRTPLLVVAKTSKNPKVIEFLLKQGADPNVQDHDPGLSALQYLAATPHFEQSEREKLLASGALILLNHGANPNLPAKTKRGQHALHFAAANNHLEMVEVLLAKGAEMAATTDSGHQPVELAAQKDHSDMVKLFLRRNVDPYSARLLFHAAANAKSMQLLQDLVAMGLDLNQPDPQGYTPIFAAVGANSTANVAFLIEKGADLKLHPPGLTLSQQAYANWGAIESLPEEKREEASGNARAIIELLEEHMGAKRSIRGAPEPEEEEEIEMLPPIPTGDGFSLEEDAETPEKS